MTEEMVEVEPLICPNCGYDLRAAVGGRCPECGLVVDAAALRTSGFPWAHRRAVGRVRAYVKTAWLVTIGSRRIAHEAARPQEPGDARSFRRVTAVLVAVALLVAYGLAVFPGGGRAMFAARPEAFRGTTAPNKWLQDIVVPWSAGATLLPVMPLLLVGVAFHLAGVHRRLFRLRSQPPRRRERGRAIADYASAPMLLLLAGVAWWCAVEYIWRRRQYPRTWMDYHLVPVWVLLAVTVFLSVLRITQWSMRVRHAGAERAVIDVPYLVALWSLGLIVWLLLLPWCVGFLWIVLDSLR